MTVTIKRIYEDASPSDGYRVLVDRIWPRGVKKVDASIGVWCKEVAPSTELRQWFGHQPERFAEFTDRYRAELDDNPAVQQLRDLVDEHHEVTLVYSAKDSEHNQAVVLRDYLSG